MGEKNRRLLVTAIAITVLAAVFVSFGLPALAGRTPQVTLAELDQPTAEEPGQQLLPVEVNPDTVQSVIATLSRPESYSRSLLVTLYWGRDGSGEQQVKLWADRGWTKTTVAVTGSVQHRLVGDGVLRLWYEGDKSWMEAPANDRTGDLAQHIPTYEDVLKTNKNDITEASYVSREGKDCVYVEVRQGEDRSDRYWIETATGLLAFCETLEGEQTVYSMKETDYAAPVSDVSVFALPDGTLPAVFQEESSS